MSKQLLQRIADYLRDGEDDYEEISEEIEKELEKPEPEPVGEVLENDGEHFDVQWSISELYKLELGTKLYTTTPDQSARIAALEKENMDFFDHIKFYGQVMKAKKAEIHNLHNIIAGLEQQLSSKTDESIDKILAMTDEQVTALQVMEGHNPYDVAKLGKLTFEIASLKTQLAELQKAHDAKEAVAVHLKQKIAELQNKEPVLLSDSVIDNLYNEPRAIEREVLKANGYKVGE